MYYLYFLAYYNERPNYVKECYKTIMNKYPDKMVNILKKQNFTIKRENQKIVDEDSEVNYLNIALCKMTKSIFFDQKISYCSNSNIDKSNKKK